MNRPGSQEATTFQEGVEALRRIRFFQDVQLIPSPQKGTDGKLRLRGEWGTTTFDLDVQPKLMESALPALAHRRHSEPDRRLLLATSYVPPKLAEQLLELRIEFLDAAGNVYLDGPIYIFISGKKAARKTIRLNRALRPAGLRLLYVLLKDPGFLSATHRELAAAADIALGSVPVILQDLRERGYLQRRGAGRESLAKSRELLFRWEQGYVELLRPKLLARICRLAGSEAKIDDLVPRLRRRPTVLLGGELAAALLTRHLRAETATIHITEDEKLAMSSLRLIPDPQGNITLLKAFGTQNARDGSPEELKFADPLLIHAELVQMSGDRIQETSEILLDEYVMPRLA
jgi:hypothetical protein